VVKKNDRAQHYHITPSPWGRRPRRSPPPGRRPPVAAPRSPPPRSPPLGRRPPESHRVAGASVSPLYSRAGARSITSIAASSTSPGAGTDGGNIVFEGTYEKLFHSATLTGKHLTLELPIKKNVRAGKGALHIKKIRRGEQSRRRTLQLQLQGRVRKLRWQRSEPNSSRHAKCARAAAPKTKCSLTSTKESPSAT
jgi:hypothetical protein